LTFGVMLTVGLLIGNLTAAALPGAGGALPWNAVQYLLTFGVMLTVGLLIGNLTAAALPGAGGALPWNAV
ncbi:hypothetical protein G7B21_29410, partial [Klebsiella pneumoniae]|nr:hypothetical protein [Klebsiella pneumoniae]